MNKDIEALRRAKKRDGWVVTRTNGDHLRWTHEPSGAIVHSSSTPSDRRTVLNIRSDLRKAEIAHEEAETKRLQEEQVARVRRQPRPPKPPAATPPPAPAPAPLSWSEACALCDLVNESLDRTQGNIEFFWEDGYLGCRKTA